MQTGPFCHLQVVENATKAVRHLKSLGCHDIEFSPEDATRSDPEFLYRVLAEVIKVRFLGLHDARAGGMPPHVHFVAVHEECESSCSSDSTGCSECFWQHPAQAQRPAPSCPSRLSPSLWVQAGATTLNIPDTTGWAIPHEYGNLYTKLLANVPGADSVIFSTHCQNDLGLATANTLAGAHAQLASARHLTTVAGQWPAHRLRGITSGLPCAACSVEVVSAEALHRA